MSRKFYAYFLGTLWVASSLLSLENRAAIAQRVEASINEDSLTTRGGLGWDGPNLPYSKLVEIKDSLVGSQVGVVILDRHQDKGNNIDIFGGNAPKPGKKVFISLWGSKVEGCFAEIIFQTAPYNALSGEQIAPILLEVGVGEQIVRLVPPSNKQPSTWQVNYTYEVYENNARYKRSGIWYMGRQLFVVDAATASVLSQAPQKKATARVTFANGETAIFPIGVGTVKRWKEAYNFNPTCQAS